MNPFNTKKKFEEIYRAEIDSLFRYCAFRVGNREQAIDIVQDVFIELWQTLEKGDEVKNHRAFLFTVLRNRIIDWYRKKKSLSLDKMMEKSEANVEKAFEPIDQNAEKSLIFSSEAGRVRDAIEKLGQGYREVMYLRLIEDLSPQEIASILKSNANIVSVRITRGLNKLREILNVKEI